MPGSSTLSITWITPLSAMMSAMITVATSPVPSAIVTRRARIGDAEPLAGQQRLEVVRPRRDPCGRQLAVIDMIQQHIGQRLLVLGLQQRLHRARGQGGEGVIGRRVHGERARARQRIGQTRGADGGDKRREPVIARWRSRQWSWPERCPRRQRRKAAAAMLCESFMVVPVIWLASLHRRSGLQRGYAPTGRSRIACVISR